jgi:hypothetical protein
VLNHHKSVVTALIVLTIPFLLAAATISAAALESGKKETNEFGFGVPMATSGNNVFMTWTNNDTGHCNVFFGKSSDGGKTLKIFMISAPNKGHIIDQSTEISASGSNVYVTWWTNKTGTLMPVFRASNDGGNTFGKTIMLNSTG